MQPGPPNAWIDFPPCRAKQGGPSNRGEVRAMSKAGVRRGSVERIVRAHFGNHSSLSRGCDVQAAIALDGRVGGLFGRARPLLRIELAIVRR
jgi:hypothetical protein